jgi:hypothetical protein
MTGEQHRLTPLSLYLSSPLNKQGLLEFNFAGIPHFVLIQYKNIATMNNSSFLLVET